MGILRIDQVTSGMVTAGDVRAYNGRLLIASGKELTGNQLMILRTWGVQEVDIVGAGVEERSGRPSPQAVSHEQLELAGERLEPLFSLANREHSAVRELFRLAVLKKVGDV